MLKLKRTALQIFTGLILLTLLSGQPLTAAGSYRGNHSTKVFHHSGCRHYNCKACTVELKSREEAINKGFRPCGVCNP